MSKKNKAKKTSPASAPQKKVDSRVEHPSYYNAHPSGVECIDIVRHYNFNVGNVIKYLWRHGLKREDRELCRKRIQSYVIPFSDIVAASRLLRELLNTEGKAESKKGGR